jgi:hypothetical protein
MTILKDFIDKLGEGGLAYGCRWEGVYVWASYSSDIHNHPHPQAHSLSWAGQANRYRHDWICVGY